MATKSLPQLIVYRGFNTPGCHVWSPFVNKLETRLRLADIRYTTEPGSLRQAPRGKIPYIAVHDQAGSDPELLGDTVLITRRLIDNGLIKDLNTDLTPAQLAQDLAVRALLEDKLFFYLTRERWIDNYYTMRDGAMAAIPFALRFFIGQLAYRNVTRALHGQGTGRYTTEEIREFKLEAWEGLNTFLTEARNSPDSLAARSGDANAPFWVLGRAEPSEADATVYGFLAAALVCPAAPETQRVVRGFPVLVDYARRIHGRYFREYELWADKV